MGFLARTGVDFHVDLLPKQDEADHGNRGEARRLVLSPLDTSRELGEDAAGPLQLFAQILGQLVALAEPKSNCPAWIVHLNEKMFPAAFTGISLLIYEPDEQEALRALQTIIQAAEPQMPPVPTTFISWRETPKELQSDMPVRLGVQTILN